MPHQNLHSYLLGSASGDKWRLIGVKRRSGILLPLFSIYSKNSFGIGDFADLKLAIDWTAETGNSILQLLPLNALGSLNCPYDCLSSFALEPAYISLNLMTGAGKRPAGMPAKGYVDYSVRQEKLRLLRELFLSLDLSQAEEFEHFQQENAYWLMHFALFKALKDHYGGRPWYEWPQAHRDRERDSLEDFWRSNVEEITFQMWLQWIIFKQLKEARDYARQKKVLLKGDLPVLVSRDSADAWQHPEFFKLGLASGAPPDMYCAKGQRWGMPTYNWETIASTGYRYIQEKLRYAQEFYDILRIDHVVGLFRIWSIPYSEPLENLGLNGFFDPADENIWPQHGRRLLKVLLQSTRMLLCAEDLGVVPQACTQALFDFGIPGNDVQRWVKDWQKRHDFLPPQEYRQLSVATLSNHDTTNWRAWWQYEAGTVDAALFRRRCAERGIDFAKVEPQLFDKTLSRHGRLRWRKDTDSADKLLKALGRKKEEVLDFIDMYENSYAEKDKLWRLLGCRGSLREEADKALLSRAIQFTLDSRSIFCIQSITDWLALADVFEADPYQYRINLPGTISPQNWSLQLPVPLEEMLELAVNRKIRRMIRDSDRV